MCFNLFNDHIEQVHWVETANRYDEGAWLYYVIITPLHVATEDASLPHPFIEVTNHLWYIISYCVDYIVQSMMPALLFMFLSIPILSVNHAILEYMSYFAWVQALIPTKFARFSRIKLSVIALKWHLLGVVLAQMTCRLPAYCSSDNTHIGVKKSLGADKVGWTKSGGQSPEENKSWRPVLTANFISDIFY